jgi:hypothetical protein
MLDMMEETEIFTRKPKRVHQLTLHPQNIDPSPSLPYLESDSENDESLDCIIEAHP